MVLDLKKLFIGNTENISDEHKMDMSKIEINGVFPFVSPVIIKYVIKSQSSLIRLKASVSLDFKYPCDRCADTVNMSYEYDFTHILVTNVNDDTNDEYVVIDDFKIDLDKLIHEDILLQIPTKVLCNPDCKGLCQKCGKNLNEGFCNCLKDVVDPRLDVLKNLLS